MNRRLLQTGNWVAAALLCLLVPAVAFAVPQTINIDGTNDFDVSNLLDDDTGDTQIQNWCTNDPEDDAPMDLGRIYVTNDTNNLYIGFEYDRECFSSPQVNLGIAFSYGAEGDGGTTDPFARKIAWNTINRKPDNVFYVVLDGFNFEAFYEWSGAAWVNIGSTINPAYGGGSNGLGMANDLGFEELSLPLSAFAANGEGGLATGETVYIEVWMTQDGTSKPPLDAGASDDVQTSTAGGTVFDTGTAVEMTQYYTYTVQNAVDNDAPVITGVRRNPFDGTLIDVTFNEPVDQTTAETAGNYSVSGGSLSVVSATRGTATNTVSLAMNSTVDPIAGTYTLSVAGVEDLAGNAATAGYEFAVKEVTFRGDFFSYLQNNGTGSDQFSVEGSVLPLDFGLTDDGVSNMTQVDAVNEIWENDIVFSWGVGAAKAQTLTVEWKFAHNFTTYESVGNRILVLDAADPATQVEEHFWDNLDPESFTDKDIDVIFTVDMSAQGPIVGDTIEIAGNVPPLSFSSPYLAMADDGLGQDAVAGDDIYTIVVTFPAGSFKNVEYKYVFNGGFECAGAGNRGVFLNDALFDTIGGTNGPIVMPLQTYDRCNVTAGDVEVVFSVDLRNSIYDIPGLSHDVRLAGGVAPLVFDPIASTLPMADDGVAPDGAAGDLIYTVSVVFPDSSNVGLEYKYVVDGEFEGQSLPNRFVFIDDTFDASGNPQVLPLDDVHLTVPVGVDGPQQPRIAVQAYPNPFNPQTTLSFVVPVEGRVRVDVFDSRGRHVRTLADGQMTVGPQTRVWDGRTDDGQSAGSGVYFARVLTPGAAAGAKLVLVK